MSEKTDIVERLIERRKLKYMGDCKCGKCQLVHIDDVCEAADTITRLRSERPSPAALEKARDRLPSITIDECCGDNLAIALCTYFDDAGDVDESGWSPATCAAYTKMCDAIHAHYLALLQGEAAPNKEK